MFSKIEKLEIANIIQIGKIKGGGGLLHGASFQHGQIYSLLHYSKGNFRFNNCYEMWHY